MLPLTSLLKYWKPVLAIALFVAYSATLSSFVKTHVDNKWELKEADRIEQELNAKNKALSDAAILKAAQDSATAAREDALRLAKEEAEQRAVDARVDAAEQRRLNNETTQDLKALQAASGSGPVAIDSDGVRDIIRSGQDAVRSRRQP